MCILKRNYIVVVENILNINQLTVMIEGGFSDTHILKSEAFKTVSRI